jgi:uncharacterized damage-inducible protein DinB
MTTWERVRTPSSAPEREMLDAFLDYHRATLMMKVDGVAHDDLRRPMVPSGTSLLGLVKHLAYVERYWFRAVLAGESVDFPWTDDDPDADWRVEPHETTEEILELYRSEVERCRAVARDGDLDAPPRMEGRDETLRFVLVHMVEETARHNGHADIMRELIDGSTGE